MFCIAKAQNTAYLKLTLYNGNIVSGYSTLKTINIVTDFGSLAIPIGNVKTINLGKQYSTEQVKTYKTKLISICNANTKASIEQFGQKNMSILFKEVYDSLKLDDAYQENEALENLYNNYYLVQYADIDDIASKDNVSGGSFKKITGKISNLKNIDLANAITTTTIPSYEVKIIEIINSISNEQFDLKKAVQFEIAAKTYISPGVENYNIDSLKPKGDGWFATSINVKMGDTIKLYATGKVKLATLSGKEYSPDGWYKGKINYKDYLKDDLYKKSKDDDVTEGDDTETSLVFGMLIYKIGSNGDKKIAGKQRTIIADKDGMLYLAIYETLYKPENSGSYKVYIVHKKQ
jgi:hypothetical protein